jgi:hypothetical protein
MPVEGVVDHPAFIALPVAGRGMLFTLLLYYWKTECRELSLSPAELFAVVRAHPTTWGTHKSVIMQIFEDLRPELYEYLQRRQQRRSIMQEVGARAAAKAHTKRLQKNAPAQLPDTEQTPAREKERYERVATPEERGARPRVAPVKRT